MFRPRRLSLKGGKLDVYLYRGNGDALKVATGFRPRFQEECKTITVHISDLPCTFCGTSCRQQSYIYPKDAPFGQPYVACGICVRDRSLLCQKCGQLRAFPFQDQDKPWTISPHSYPKTSSCPKCDGSLLQRVRTCHKVIEMDEKDDIYGDTGTVCGTEFRVDAKNPFRVWCASCIVLTKNAVQKTPHVDELSKRTWSRSI